MNCSSKMWWSTNISETDILSHLKKYLIIMAECVKENLNKFHRSDELEKSRIQQTAQTRPNN